MAEMYLTEAELHRIKAILAEKMDSHDAALLDKLCSPMELAVRGYHVIQAVKPLIASVWITMNEREDANRFVVERMLHDIDDVLDYWIVPGAVAKDELGKDDGESLE